MKCQICVNKVQILNLSSIDMESNKILDIWDQAPNLGLVAFVLKLG